MLNVFLQYIFWIVHLSRFHDGKDTYAEGIKFQNIKKRNNVMWKSHSALKTPIITLIFDQKATKKRHSSVANLVPNLVTCCQIWFDLTGPTKFYNRVFLAFCWRILAEMVVLSAKMWFQTHVSNLFKLQNLLPVKVSNLILSNFYTVKRVLEEHNIEKTEDGCVQHIQGNSNRQ